MDDQRPTVGYTVTGQAETTDLGPTGVYVPGVRVSFRTEGGANGSVFVPQSDFTVEAVRRAIGERAAVIEQVNGLTG